MVTLTQPTREFYLPRRIRRFVYRKCIWSNNRTVGILLIYLLLLIVFFFFLASWLLDFKLSPGKVEGEDEETGEEGERSTLESS